MGNCATLKAGAQHKPTNTVSVTPKSNSLNLCLDKQGTSTKYLLYKSIQNKDIETTKKLHLFFDIDPNEEISVKGYHWTALHYAAFFESTLHLEFFLKLAYFKNKSQFVDIINLQTSEKYTPLMIAAMHGRRLIIEQLFKIGGVKLNLKDKKGRTAKELAKSNGKSNCAQLIADQETKGTTQVNEALLKKFQEIETEITLGRKNSQNAEDDPKYAELLLKGKRIPCMICQENFGLLKYTKCCGQPIHSFCGGGKLKNCPYCKRTGFDLTDEINYPERAFEL